MKRYISILVGCLFLLSYHVNADNFLQDLDNEESDDNWENSDNTNEETFLDDDALPDDENWKVSDADEQEKDNPNDFKENLDENWKVNDADEQEKDNPNDFKENLEEELDLETRNIGAPIRLVNGGAPNRGRVEVYHNGSWGTVCDDHWDILDAKVVCRQLGFPGATLAPCCARFGQGSNRTWMDDVQCTGSERYLSQCRFRGWGREDCSHSEDAGVVCSNPVTQTPPLSSIAPSASTPPPQVSSSVPIVPSVSSTSIPAVATSVAPVYTTRRPLYTTRRPWYTTRRPWYTTRRPWYTTRRPWFTTRRPWFPTRRPWYTTRRPWFPTRRPWYPTRRPWFTTRRPWYPTRRPSRRRPRLNILRILIKMIKGITILLDGIKDGIKAGISRAGARQYKRELVSMLGQLEGKADAVKDSSDETEIILLKDLGQVRERAHVLMKQLDEVPDDKEGQ